MRQSPVPFDALTDELDASAHGAYDLPYTPMPGGIGGRIVPACRSGGAFGGDGGMVQRLAKTSGSTPAPSGPGWGGQRRTILCGAARGTPAPPRRGCLTCRPPARCPPRAFFGGDVERRRKLVRAAANGDDAKVKRLLKAKADVDYDTIEQKAGYPRPGHGHVATV